MNRILLICLAVIFSLPCAAQSIKVYAASSMTDSIKDIGKHFYQKTGIKVITVFGGSASLARQIDKGAPADIYISANQKWMEYLVKGQAIRQQNTKNIAHNQLVLIAGKSSGVNTFDVLNKDAWLKVVENSRIAVGQPESVPAGIYAKQSLQSIGIWDQLESHMAGANNVRFALALVERGETDVGIVYKTDALQSDAVTILANFPDDTHEPIIYPAAIVSDSDNARKFYEFLSGEVAQNDLEKYGFHTISSIANLK